MWKIVQKNLIAGFIALLPAIATIYVIHLVFSIIDRFLGQFITNSLKTLKIIRVEEGVFYFLGIYTPFSERLVGIGFVLTIFIVFIVGSLKRNEKNQHYFERVDRLFHKIPIANTIYSSIEQGIAAFSQQRTSFKRVVMVEYPRKGVYTLGFITGESRGEVEDKTNHHCLHVFLPTTPNPATGWLALVPKEEVIELEMTVEQGIKMIVSGGVVVPPTVQQGYEKENLSYYLLEKDDLDIKERRKKDE